MWLEFDLKDPDRVKAFDKLQKHLGAPFEEEEGQKKSLLFCGRQWVSHTREFDKKKLAMILRATKQVEFEQTMPKLRREVYEDQADALRRASKNRHNTLDEWHLPLRDVAKTILLNQDMTVAKLIARTRIGLSDVVRTVLVPIENQTGWHPSTPS